MLWSKFETFPNLFPILSVKGIRKTRRGKKRYVIPFPSLTDCCELGYTSSFRENDTLLNHATIYIVSDF